MRFPEGWSESRVRSHLAVNRRNLSDEKVSLVKVVKDATSRIAAIDKQIHDIDTSVEVLNSEHSR